jgi:hypothetical protein
MSARCPVPLPVGTSLSEVVPASRDSAIDIEHTLQELQRKPRASVPSNMTMDEPCTWIICYKCHHHPSACREDRGVATSRVVEGQCRGAWELAAAAAENPVVVAVQMDWMWEWWALLPLDDPVYPAEKMES